MKRLRTDMDNPKMQLVPMIDIVFQLLVFFFLGTHFRVPEGELDAYLPEEGAPTQLTRRAADVDEIRVTLQVTQAGALNKDEPPSVLLDGRGSAAAGGKGGMEWLESQLRRLGADKRMRDNVPVIIEAEPELSYKWVIEALNICRKANFAKVNFAASKRNAPDVKPPPPG